MTYRERLRRWHTWGLLVAALALLAAGCAALQHLTGTFSLEADPAGAGAPLVRVRLTLPPGVRSLDDLLEPVRAANRVPALAAAVVSGGRLTAIGVVGVRKAGASEPAVLTDRFHIGSCTKSMTATLIGMLVEDGRLKWETTIASVFPELSDKIRPEYRDVTVDQLLHHQSGLPDDRAGADYYARVRTLSGPDVEQRLHLVVWALQQPPVSAPGAKCVYSNAGFNILGAMAERVAGQSWRELMRTRLFEPLGMDSAGFGTPSTPGRVDQPWGHRPVGRFWPRLKPDPESHQPRACEAAGNVCLSLSDWAKYAAWHLDAAQRRCRLLRGETFEHLHTAAPGTTFACGWGAGPDKRLGRVLGHTGSIGTWYAEIWIAPERDLALLIATNEGEPRGSVACSEAREALLASCLPASMRPESRPVAP